MESFATGQARHQRRWKKILIPLITLVILIVLIVLFIRNLSSPAVGTLSQTPPSQAEKTDPYAKPGNFNSKYLTFQYPAHFKSVPVKITGDYLEITAYSSTDNTSKQINVGVYKGSLSNDSGISYHQQHPELYKEDTSRVGIEFIKLDGTENTFFLAHNGLIAAVSATAAYANLNGEAYYVASSLQWK